MSVVAPQILEKQPIEELFFSIDFTNLLGEGEELTGTPTVESVRTDGEDSDLSISGITLIDSNTTVKFFITGGTHAKRYRVECTADTSGGQKLQGDGILIVRDK